MVIGNDCLAGFLYRKHNMKFDHPFMYSTIVDKEFYNLINNFNNINFRKYTYYPLTEARNDYSHISLINKLGKHNLYCFLIDNYIEISFLHHVQSDRHTEKIKINSEVYYNKIIDVLCENYDNRVNRMTDDVKFIYNEKKTVNLSLIDNLIYNRKLSVLFTTRDIENTDTMTVFKKIKPTEKIRNIVNRTYTNFIFNQ